MSVLDIFNNDAFHVLTMSDALREVKYVPGFISKMGLFSTTSVSTIDIAIEKDKEQQLFIVRSSPRGGVGQTFGKGGRSMRKLGVPHFQVDDAIYADEVQSVRAFGEERALETFQGRIAERAAEVRQSFALTEEFHRLNIVINGKMLDADNSVIYDFFDEMGESQPAPIDWDLDNANPARGVLRQKSTDLVRAMGTSLGGLPFSGIVALCGDNFFDALVKHKEVYDTYLNYTAAATLRQGLLDMNNQSVGAGAWASIYLFNILWVNYRGITGVEVPTDEARFVPLGVPGLFRTVFAPADYIETVNTMGLEMYVKTVPMPNDKGVSVEQQTNVLHYVTRPRVLMRATLT
ncbi:major capsid protein [Mesorhizobium sp.]|uniref:major capsid protein n=1 Tax=Mesorhizobium sp. TaxID=1871066 RepID=UPI0012117729|nr:major capsid protein [Mesorhizobium sp.]TIS37510.1 MAG: major capsid protein [Mesorhizobium sp.]